MEKTCRVPCSVTYGAKIDNAYFVRSSKLEEATRETEDAFARVFEHGNRKKALERLRQLGPSETHHFSTWRSGLLIGASVPLLVEGVVTSEWSEPSRGPYACSHIRTGCLANTRREIPYWAALLQLFGAEFLPVLFGLLFTLNLISWNYGRVNYVLIFELDVSPPVAALKTGLADCGGCSLAPCSTSGSTLSCLQSCSSPTRSASGAHGRTSGPTTSRQARTRSRSSSSPSR